MGKISPLYINFMHFVKTKSCIRQEEKFKPRSLHSLNKHSLAFTHHLEEHVDC